MREMHGHCARMIIIAVRRSYGSHNSVRLSVTRVFCD